MTLLSEKQQKGLITIGKWTFLSILSGLIFLYVLRPNWGIDIYWHMKVGEWVLKHRAIPHTDIFSAVDQSRPWTPFQWLYEVIVYVVWRQWGFFALKVFHATIYLIAFMLMYRVFAREFKHLSYTLFFTMVFFFLNEDRLRLRPEAFNLLFLAIVMPYVLEGPHKATKKELLVLLIVSILWGNIHAGGSLMLPVLFGGLLFGRFLNWLVNNNVPVVEDLKRFLASSLVLPFVPGFLKGVYTAFFMYARSYDLIPEWHPPIVYFDPSFVGRLTGHHVICGSVPYLIAMTVFIGVSLVLLRKRLYGLLTEYDAGHVVVALGLAILSIKSARFISFAVFPLYFIVKWWVLPLLNKDTDYYLRVALSILTVLALMLSYEYNVLLQRGGITSALADIKKDHDERFPVKAANALVAMGIKGKIFHLTQWGGFLIWKLYPDCTVFTDGRGNFTPKEAKDLDYTHRPYERYWALERAWKRYHFDIVIFPPPMFPLLTWDPDKWVFIYGDSKAEVFLRNTPENRENFKRVAKYWHVHGIIFPDTDLIKMQTAYLDVLSYEFFKAKKTQKQLRMARAKLQSKDPLVHVQGLKDMGFIYFTARRFETAAWFFKQVMNSRPDPISAAYLAWSYFNAGKKQAAKSIITQYFINVPHPPLLSRSMRKIVDLLCEGVGLPPVYRVGRKTPTIQNVNKIGPHRPAAKPIRFHVN